MKKIVRLKLQEKGKLPRDILLTFLTLKQKIIRHGYIAIATLHPSLILEKNTRLNVEKLSANHGENFVSLQKVLRRLQDSIEFYRKTDRVKYQV